MNDLIKRFCANTSKIELATYTLSVILTLSLVGQGSNSITFALEIWLLSHYDMLRQFSLGTVGLVVGGIMSVAGIYAYTIGNSTINLVGFFYGIPILLGGLALKSSEVKPTTELVPVSKEVLKLRETQATSTQKQIRSDLCRYRYGIRAHLDEVLEKLGLSPTNEECPKLVGLYEQITNTESLPEAYSLVLRFNAPLIPWETWVQKQDKFTSFFGPGIIASVSQVDAQTIDLHLTKV